MHFRRVLFLFLGLVVITALNAQPKDNSPITRFGIGDIHHLDFNQTGATGGLFGAWVDPYRANPVNPATLPFLSATSLELGLAAKYNTYQLSNSEQIAWSGNLDYISLAFPLKSRINQKLDPDSSPWDFGMGVHIAPYSLVGYDIQFTEIVSGIDSVRNLFLGEGSFTQAAWSTGVKYKDLSFGVQASYIFGKMDNRSQLNLLSETASYSTRNESRINGNGFALQLGGLYRIQLDPLGVDQLAARKQRILNIGFYAGTPTNLNTRSNRLVQRVNVPYSNNAAVARDTLVNENDVAGTGKLPARFGIGATLQKGDYYQVGINLDYRNWSIFSLDGKEDLNFEYRDAIRYSVGGEWTPNAQVFKDYLKTVRYRMGLYYESDPRQLNDFTSNSYGIQIGAGFPVILPRQQITFLDLGLEAGRRGALTTQQDSYIRIRLAVTLNDNSWFYKRKYN